MLEKVEKLIKFEKVRKTKWKMVGLAERRKGENCVTLKIGQVNKKYKN